MTLTVGMLPALSLLGIAASLAAVLVWVQSRTSLTFLPPGGHWHRVASGMLGAVFGVYVTLGAASLATVSRGAMLALFIATLGAGTLFR